MDDHRYATQRGRYLARITDLREPEAKAIAYTELGYSFNGLAKHLDTSESTVKDYMGKAMALYGLGITETLLPEQELPDYQRVDPGYHRSLSNRRDKEKWIQLVDRYREKLPREWVTDVLREAKADGISPSAVTD